jgi:hypothetical protein
MTNATLAAAQANDSGLTAYQVDQLLPSTMLIFASM